MRRLKRFAIYLCACLVLAGAVISTPIVAANSNFSNAMSPEKMSINVIEADVRDVLSAIAINLGYSVIFTGEPGSISIKLDETDPQKALDYVLKIMELSYSIEGNTMFVGTSEKLSDSKFTRSLSLTEIALNFIESKVFIEQIQKLGLPVTVLTFDYRTDRVWIQGLPQDISKVRELARVLDVVENEVPMDEEGVPQNSSMKTLSTIKVTKVTATDFNHFLKVMGINCGVAVDEYDERLWLYATPEERKTITTMRDQINRNDGNMIIDSANSFSFINIGNLSKEDATSVIEACGADLEVVSVNSTSKCIWVSGPSDQVSRAKSIITRMSLEAGKIGESVFIYNLKNITSNEAFRRLENAKFNDSVAWYAMTDNIAEFSSSIIIYCNPDYSKEVRSFLEAIDIPADNLKGYYPIFTADNEVSLSPWINVLVEVLPSGIVSRDNFKILPIAANLHVLFVKDVTPEVANLSEIMIAKILSTSSSTTEQKYTWEEYQKYCAEKGLTPTIEGWRDWVFAQVVGGGAPKTLSSTPLPELPSISQPTTPNEMTPLQVSNKAQSVIRNFLYTYTALPTDNEESIFKLVSQEIAKEGLPLKNYEIVPGTHFTEPTETSTGWLRMIVKFTLENGDTFEQEVQLTLPRAIVAIEPPVTEQSSSVPEESSSVPEESSSAPEESSSAPEESSSAPEESSSSIEPSSKESE